MSRDLDPDREPYTPLRYDDRRQVSAVVVIVCLIGIGLVLGLAKLWEAFE
jgi:hypothetical protein